MESYRSRALEEAVEVEHLQEVLLERELQREAVGSYRKQSAWRSYKSRALQGGPARKIAAVKMQLEAIEVEHLKKL